MTDLRADSPDGSDRLGNVELFFFSDGLYSIADLFEAQTRPSIPAHYPVDGTFLQ